MLRDYDRKMNRYDIILEENYPPKVLPISSSLDDPNAFILMCADGRQIEIIASPVDFNTLEIKLGEDFEGNIIGIQNINRGFSKSFPMIAKQKNSTLDIHIRIPGIFCR
jgi:hypothetical protein